MAPWKKLLFVLGILGVLILGVWAIFYALIWSGLKAGG